MTTDQLIENFIQDLKEQNASALEDYERRWKLINHLRTTGGDVQFAENLLNRLDNALHREQLLRDENAKLRAELAGGAK